jgi:uncharacterized membrane protein
MAHAQAQVMIERPVDTVFNFVANGLNNPRWRSSVTDIQRLPGKPLNLGAVYKQGLKGPGGRRIDGDYEITAYEPNKLIKFQVIAGPARPTGTYEFEAAGSSTRLTFTLDFVPKGLSRLIDPMIASSMKSEVAMLADLKVYLEMQHL